MLTTHDRRMNRLENLTATELRRLADALDCVPRLAIPERAVPDRGAVWADRTVTVELDADALGAYIAERAGIHFGGSSPSLLVPINRALREVGDEMNRPDLEPFELVVVIGDSSGVVLEAMTRSAVFVPERDPDLQRVGVAGRYRGAIVVRAHPRADAFEVFAADHPVLDRLIDGDIAAARSRGVAHRSGQLV
jgi:hypothetical protein